MTRPARKLSDLLKNFPEILESIEKLTQERDDLKREVGVLKQEVDILKQENEQLRTVDLNARLLRIEKILEERPASGTGQRPWKIDSIMHYGVGI